MAWECIRCECFMAKNQRNCPQCGYTVFKPVSDREEEPRRLGENEVFAPGVLEQAMAEAEGKELPLKDRPGGEVIGTAVIHNGQWTIKVTDPEVKRVVDQMLQFPLTGRVIGMVDDSLSHDFGGPVSEKKDDWGDPKNWRGV